MSIAKHIEGSSLATRLKEVSSFGDAALLWFEFGLQVIPVIPGTKRPAIKWGPWLNNLSKEKIVNYWKVNPKHEIAAIVGNGVVVFDIDTVEAGQAMDRLMTKYNMSPLMVAKTTQGNHQYFKREGGIAIKADSHSTSGDPDRIDIKTGRNMIMLPPSTGKRLLFSNANHVDELTPASQDFIDAVFIHNGRSAPSAPVAVPKQIRKMGAGPSSLVTLKSLLVQIDPDVGYQDWFNAIAAVYHETDGSDEGLDLVDAWSSEGDKYKGLSDVDTTWRSLRSGHGNPITIATLFSMAMDNVEAFERCVTVVVESARQSVQQVSDCAVALEPEAIDATLENVGSSKPIQALSTKKPHDTSNWSAKESPTGTGQSGESVILTAWKSVPSMSFPQPPKEEGRSILPTLPNVKYLVNRFKIVVRYNVISKVNEMLVPGHVGCAENLDNTALSYIRSLAIQHNMSPTMVPEYLEAIGDDNPFNPVGNWINSKPWDGIDRLPEICATLDTVERFPQDLKDVCINKWLLSAVAAVLSKGEFSTRGVLTLQGGQGIGKSRWIKSLINDEGLANDVIVLGHHLDPANKDSVMIAIRNWICEIGELDGSFRKDIALMKGFLTNPSDRIRRPYARLDNNYKRRTVFAASVNDEQFLVDTTGNTRFFTLPLEKINWDHGIDMQQVFAQLAVNFTSGGQWWLTDDEQSRLEEMNKEHRTVNAIRELVLDAIDFDCIGTEGLEALTPTELLQRLEVRNIKNSDTRDCGAVLREVIGQSKRINGRDKWRVPFKRKDFTEVPKCGSPTVTAQKVRTNQITVPGTGVEGTDQGGTEAATPSATPDPDMLF